MNSGNGWPIQTHHVLGECEKEDSIGSKLMGEVMITGFTALFFDLPRSEMRKEAARKRTTAEPQTLPSAIADGKRTGLNCRINATIISTNRDGSEEQQSVRIINHARLTDISSLKQQTAALLKQRWRSCLRRCDATQDGTRVPS